MLIKKLNSAGIIKYVRSLKTINKILVPIDESEEANKAAEFAADLAKDVGAEVLVITVISMPRFFSPILNMPQNQTITKKLLEDEEKYVKSYMTPIVEHLSKTGVKASSKIVKTDISVVNAIRNTADDEEADLIVIGSTGMTAVKRVLLGSISSGVVTHAHCPVLVVR